MPIYSLKLFNHIGNRDNLLANGENFSDLPFLLRYSTTTGEMFLFLSRTFMSQTGIGNLNGCKQDGYMGWSFIDNENMGCVIITDLDYDKRVAHIVMKKAMDMYKGENENWDWQTRREDISRSNKCVYINGLILDYQHPKEKDTILKINKGLDDTKETLHQSIDKMLERGEKIDVLIQKSQDLSFRSKKFLKKSKDMNSWCNNCTIM